jgi:protein SCO1/2
VGASRLAGALAALVLVAALPAGGAEQTAAALRREIEAVGVVERLGAAVPREASFVAADGSPLALGALAGRPVLLSFNYTSCPKLCGLQLAGLAKALRDLRWDGGGFTVLTVSVDPAEKPAQLRAYGEAFVRQAGGGEGVARSWRFVRGDKARIDALAEAVGFKYRYDPRSGEFAHQATLVVLTGDGRVSSYLHGVTYAPDALREAVARARGGAVATAAEQRSLGGFLLTCMGFDPASPAPLALKITRAGGTGVLLLFAAFLAVQFTREVRLRRTRSRRDTTP